MTNNFDVAVPSSLRLWMEMHQNALRSLLQYVALFIGGGGVVIDPGKVHV